jgi:hypothetical protein
LLVPEFAEACEAGGGCASGLVVLAVCGACGTVKGAGLADADGVLIVNDVWSRDALETPTVEARALVASGVGGMSVWRPGWRHGKRVPCSCGVPLGLSCGLRETGEKKSLMLLFCGFIVGRRSACGSNGGVVVKPGASLE